VRAGLDTSERTQVLAATRASRTSDSGSRGFAPWPVSTGAFARPCFSTMRLASPRLSRIANCVFLYSAGSWYMIGVSAALSVERFVVFSSSISSRAFVSYIGTVE